MYVNRPCFYCDVINKSKKFKPDTIQSCRILEKSYS